jgi:hypothetical protein
MQAESLSMMSLLIAPFRADTATAAAKIEQASPGNSKRDLIGKKLLTPQMNFEKEHH